MLIVNNITAVYLKIEDKQHKYKEDKNDQPNINHFPIEAMVVIKKADLVVYTDEDKISYVLKMKH